MNNKSITKSNALIDAGYRLSLTEMQIVLYGISLINPISKNFPLKYQININHFAKLFGRDHKDIYGEVKKAILSKFWERDFRYKDDKGNIVTNRWLTQVKHQDKNAFIQIKFSEEVQPYLHQLSQNFTKYYIKNIADFKSIYSVRFYELAIMELKNKGKCRFNLEIKKIRERLELKEKYKRFYDIKNRILEPAKKEINKHSDINFSYKVIKLCRSPHEVEFTISRKEKELPSHSTLSKHKLLKLPTITIEKAKDIIKKTRSGWDIYAIEQQFYDYAKKKGVPKDIDKAFIGFVKKKTSKPP